MPHWEQMWNSAVRVNGSARSDFVTVGGGNLDFVPGSVAVTGGGGTDTLFIDDSGDPYSDPYTLTAQSVSRPFAGAVSYSVELTVPRDQAVPYVDRRPL